MNSVKVHIFRAWSHQPQERRCYSHHQHTH